MYVNKPQTLFYVLVPSFVTLTFHLHLKNKPSKTTKDCKSLFTLNVWYWQVNLEKIHIPAEITTQIKHYSIHKFLLSVVCNLFWALMPLLASTWVPLLVLYSDLCTKLTTFPLGQWQVTSQCAFVQLSVVHSQPDGRKEEGRTGNAKTISPHEIFGRG